MDDIVKAAMAKWPNVPDCYGWLGLDARGRWWMRDDAAQAAGPFAGPGATPQSRGSELRHRKLIEFIERNYGCDERGRWFFQNGPQRVYVELERAPWVWRLSPEGGVSSHTGQPAVYRSSWLDEQGHLYLVTDLGLGVVHTLDMHWAAEAVESGRWTPQECPFASLPELGTCVLSPSGERGSVC
ncbi:DUF2946 family protein [Macromonas nakdongensis]|uniref:DUF2946 family protein n=1 Tax=Macromonas nakdongensis TaxID=1843082 RepID=UPI000C323DF9|nr:DUF2946 family protein [Macromonas nakdongensis]